MMSGHPTRDEDFDLYALGTLEGDERAAIERHLAGCEECQRKLGEACGRMAMLALAAPRKEPAAAVKERLLRQIREADDAADAQMAPAAARPRVAVPESGVGDRFGSILGHWWTAVLVPVTAVLLVVTGLLWKQIDNQAHLIERLRNEAQVSRKQLDYQRRVADLMDPNTINVSLRPMPGMPQGDAMVHYNAVKGKLVYDGWIEPAPSDKSYQLWVVPMEGSPISVGVFNPVTQDRASWIASVPEGVQAKAFAITMEPAGGEDQPTGPQILVGNGS